MSAKRPSQSAAASTGSELRGKNALSVVDEANPPAVLRHEGERARDAVDRRQSPATVSAASQAELLDAGFDAGAVTEWDCAESNEAELDAEDDAETTPRLLSRSVSLSAAQSLAMLPPPVRRVLSHSDSRGTADQTRPGRLMFFPDELLVRIFTFLTKAQLEKCAGVCRRWRNVAYDATLWRTVDIKSRKVRQVSAMRLNTLLLRRVRCLSYSGGKLLSSPDQPISFRAVGLTTLNLSNTLIDDTSIFCALVSGAPNLTHLNVEGCLQINTHAFSVLVEACPLLVSLYAKLCDGLTGEIIARLYETRPVRDLCVGWTAISPDSFHGLSGHCGVLEKLDLSGMAMRGSPESYHAIFSALYPRLTSIDLSDCIHVDDACLELILLHCPSLQRISLSRCRHVSFDLIRKMAAHIVPNSNASALNVHGCFPAIRQHLRQAYPSLILNQIESPL